MRLRVPRTGIEVHCAKDRHYWKSAVVWIRVSTCVGFTCQREDRATRGLRQVNSPRTGSTTANHTNEGLAAINDERTGIAASTTKSLKVRSVARIGLEWLKNEPEDDCRRPSTDDLDDRSSIDFGSDLLRSLSDPKIRWMPEGQTDLLVLVKDPIGTGAVCWRLHKNRAQNDDRKPR
jgi:hypothetical protein